MKHERRALTGDRNQCAGCGEFFNSSFAFDKHRTGEHAGNGRRCLSPDEMQKKGMLKSSADFWITEAREKAPGMEGVTVQQRLDTAREPSGKGSA